MASHSNSPSPDSDDGNLVYGACGVLTNVMSHCDYHQLLPKDIVSRLHQDLPNVKLFKSSELSPSVNICTKLYWILKNLLFRLSTLT